MFIIHRSQKSVFCLRLCCVGMEFNILPPNQKKKFIISITMYGFVFTFGKLNLIRHFTFHEDFFLFHFDEFIGYAFMNYIYLFNSPTFASTVVSSSSFFLFLLFCQTKIERHWNGPMSLFVSMFVGRCLCPLFKMLYSSSFRVYSFIQWNVEINGIYAHVCVCTCFILLNQKMQFNAQVMYDVLQLM